jgi:hypothetical protein
MGERGAGRGQRPSRSARARRSASRQVLVASWATAPARRRASSSVGWSAPTSGRAHRFTSKRPVENWGKLLGDTRRSRRSWTACSITQALEGSRRISSSAPGRTRGFPDTRRGSGAGTRPPAARRAAPGQSGPWLPRASAVALSSSVPPVGSRARHVARIPPYFVTKRPQAAVAASCARSTSGSASTVWTRRPSTTTRPSTSTVSTSRA